MPDATHRRGAAGSPARRIVRPTHDRWIGPVDLCGGFARISASRASRKVEQWAARRAMSRLRRQPAPIAETLRAAGNVLIVCHGNIIRSPYAANVVKQAVTNPGAVSVMSAGLEAVAGNPAHPVALEMATARRIDLRSHTASPLTPEMVATSDVIFVMDIPQLVSLRRRFPEAGARTFLLTCLAPDTPLEVADPVDGDASRFHRCFDHISKAVSPIIDALQEQRHPNPAPGTHAEP